MTRRVSWEQQRSNHRAAVAVLQEAEVAVLKWRMLQGEAKRGLAAEYGVSLWTIRAIARGETWGDVLPMSPGDSYKGPLAGLLAPGLSTEAEQAENERLMWIVNPALAEQLGYKRAGAAQRNMSIALAAQAAAPKLSAENQALLDAKLLAISGEGK